MTKVAFIGLGTMGLPMARNLLKGGYEVTGFDVNAQAIAQHEAHGGQVATSSRDAVVGAEFIFTMLPAGQHVKEVLKDCLTSLEQGSLVIEMSTIYPLETDEVRASLTTKGIGMVDAPVGRTSEHAHTGTLLIMAGGEEENLARARPLLALLGDPIVDCGGPGLGSRMKIINNFLSNMLNIATAEALTLAEAVGLKRDLAIDVMAGTAAGRGHMTTTYPSKVLAGDLTPAFMLDLAYKDQGLALKLAAAMGIETKVGEAAQAVYEQARLQERGQQDWTAVYAMMREKVGLSD